MSIISLFLLVWNVNAITYNKASFIHSVSPFDKKEHSDAVVTGYGLFDIKKKTQNRKDTHLFSKKKAGGAPQKMKVKLLKNVAGTGQAGMVIKVTPAFFNNKLRPTGSAKLISDEEVEKDELKSQALAESNKAAAKVIQEALNDVSIVIKRKAGPEGHLFGGIGPKTIIKELSEKVPNDMWKRKGVKVQDFLDENGEKIKGDIKEVGKFTAKIKFSTDMVSKVDISVEAEP